MEERKKNIDIFKGLLIILVVVGHYDSDIVHDVIFLFHMPLFFIISGLLLKKEHLMEGTQYIKAKIQNLMFPYFTYLIIDLFLIRHDYAVGSIVRALWGGRAVPGVYWYITCFLFTLFLFSIMVRYLSEKAIKCLILMGGLTAVLESHIVNKVHFLKSPGIPWNLDVALMALVYIAIGYFCKKQIKTLLESDLLKYDIAASVIAVGLVIFCGFNYGYKTGFYYFDMKPVCYSELVLAIMIPCAFGIVLARLIHRIAKARWLWGLQDFLILCGKTTIPIMFMHVPLNHWKDYFGYGRLIYMAIGIEIPLVITHVFNKNPVMRKVLGIPKLNRT